MDGWTGLRVSIGLATITFITDIIFLNCEIYVSVPKGKGPFLVDTLALKGFLYFKGLCKS